MYYNIFCLRSCSFLCLFVSVTRRSYIEAKSVFFLLSLLTVKIEVLLVSPPMARSKVDQLELKGAEVHDNVLVLQKITNTKK